MTALQLTPEEVHEAGDSYAAEAAAIAAARAQLEQLAEGAPLLVRLAIRVVARRLHRRELTTTELAARLLELAVAGYRAELGDDLAAARDRVRRRLAALPTLADDLRDAIREFSA